MQRLNLVVEVLVGQLDIWFVFEK